MARPSKETPEKPAKGNKGKAAAAAATAADTEKPLPEKRPGTSGTENLLISSRRQASEQFVKAQRAEKAYRAKKHATLARHNYNETKGHFKEAGSHLKLALKGSVAVVRGVPHLFREKQEERRRKTDHKKRERHREQKKRLEEALAREAGQHNDDDDSGSESDGESR